MATYNWVISMIEGYPQSADDEDQSFVVHWRRQKHEAEKMMDVYGAQTVELDPGEPFIPFGELTPETVEGWLEASLGEKRMAEIHSALDEDFARMSVTSAVPPWDVPPVEPVYVPSVVSDRQFFQMAALSGLITHEEALAAVTVGAVPAILQSIVDGIEDPTQKFGAQMLLSGATIFDRNHPLTEAVGVHLGWTSEQIDQFFIRAAQL